MRTVAAPMPREPPVIKATLPSSDKVGTDGMAKKAITWQAWPVAAWPGSSTTWIQIRVAGSSKVPLKDCPNAADITNNAD
jgi:hypothetical protein